MTYDFLFFFNSMQISRMCSWILLKSAECLQDLSLEVPGVIVMAILIVLTGCRCVCPGQSKSASYSLSSLSHCLGQMGLAYPFWDIYCKKKKKKKRSSQNFNYKNPVPKNSI